jgi:hypothetical protein
MLSATVGSSQVVGDIHRFNLEDFANGPIVDGIEYDVDQAIITGIGVSGNNVYICNTGQGGTYDTSNKEVRLMTIDNAMALTSTTNVNSASGTQLRDMHINKDEDKLLLGDTNLNLYAADWSGLTNTSNISNPLGAAVSGCCWNHDGTKVAVVGSAGTRNIARSYSLSTAYDLSTASALSSAINIGNVTNDLTTNGAVTGVKFNEDGTRVYFSTGENFNSNDKIREFTLSTAYTFTASDLTTPNYTLDMTTYIDKRSEGDSGYSNTSVYDSMGGFDWTEDGRSLFVCITFGGGSTALGTPISNNRFAIFSLKV